MIKILVHAPIKADSTSFYRGWGPLNHLQRNGYVQLINSQAIENSWDTMQSCDILFLQRPSTVEEVSLMELARICNVPAVIDYDDDYLNIPETNPRSNIYKEPGRREAVKRCIEMASAIITSTISIREEIASITGKDRSVIHVVPNGIDEFLYDCSKAYSDDLQFHRDVILWRGGDTHEKDIEPFLDKIVELYENFTSYKWAFMGHTPEEFLKRVNNDRIILYKFDDINIYFERIFDLRPKLTIVPWADTVFNRGKSSCSWLEATLAGSSVVFPNWSTEFVPGMIGYSNADTFAHAVRNFLSAPNPAPAVKSFETLQRFTLGALNPTRLGIFQQLIDDRKPMGFRSEVFSRHLSPLTDEQFYHETYILRCNQETEAYREGHSKVVDWLLLELEPSSVIEFGCGPGPMIEAFCNRNVSQVVGFDSNPYFKEYFDKRNPHYTSNFVLQNILEVEPDGVFDLGVSIEVFEHIPMDVLEPFIEKLADHFKHFYFSSTPFYQTRLKDLPWGHVNVQTWDYWVQLFTKHGFELVSNPQQVSKWDILFKSTKV